MSKLGVAQDFSALHTLRIVRVVPAARFRQAGGNAMRYVTFRFDDGFIGGARKAATLLAPDRASFFVVADLVTGGTDLRDAPGFLGCDFGSVAQWREISAQGHDVQLHSCSHPDMSQLAPAEQLREVQGSLALVRTIHDGPYIFCYPYNILADIDLAAEGLVAGGFTTRSSDEPVQFNAIDGTADVFCLNSWAVRERHFDDVVEQLSRAVPDGSWTILTFHSLDGEGWEPWSSWFFARLVAQLRLLHYTIVTVAAMVDAIGQGRAGAVVQGASARAAVTM